MTFPVAVLSFNRPEMLASVLRSLLYNRSLADGDVASIHLFQDGAVNAFSDRRYASDDDIAACIETFKNLVPEGTVHLADGNIGVALNYERAEAFMFDTLQAPAAIFLEDDLVLGVGYTQLLTKLIGLALENPAIGMVSAYGRSPATPVALQKQHESIIDHMGQNWGFALTRAHWIERQAMLTPYMDLIRRIDYRDRPTDAISAWRQHLGGDPEPTSQDDCKNLISLRLGRARLSTFANFAAYVGKSGLHMDEAQFISAGFPLMRQIPYEGFGVCCPSDAEISDILFCEVTRRNLLKLCQAQKHRLDRSLVRAAYRLFLGREPESEAVIAEKLSLEFPIVLIHDLLTSLEYRDGEPTPLDLSSLVLNRRPECDDECVTGRFRSIDGETARVGSRLFLSAETAIQGLACRSFNTTHEILRSLFASEDFRELYATALGTREFFLER
jgi:hypothetical protein